MSSARAEPITIAGDHDIHVSGLLQSPAGARACYLLAHGAGAGMQHPFLAAVAAGLAGRGIATLRYQFPYMERGGKRPDPPHLAQATVRAAVAAARRALPGMALVAGGKSFGGRMTSQAQARAPLPDGPIATVPSDVYHTSAWRTIRPVITLEKCTRCNFCWKFCPDDAIEFEAQGYPVIRADYCKGCGICAQECPPHAIAMVAEE